MTVSDEVRQQKRRRLMNTEQNVQTVKDFFTAMGSYNKQDLLALVTDDIE